MEISNVGGILVLHKETRHRYRFGASEESQYQHV